MENSTKIVFKDVKYYGSIPNGSSSINADNADEHSEEYYDSTEALDREAPLSNEIFNRNQDIDHSSNFFKGRFNNITNVYKIFNHGDNTITEDLTEVGNGSDLAWPYENVLASDYGEDVENEDDIDGTERGRENSILRIFKRNRDNSILSLFSRDRSNTVTSIKKNYYKIVRYKHFKKFLSIAVISFLIWSFFTLAFLPRTSLARDFRRYHHSTAFTKQEVYRSFIHSFDKDSDASFLKLVDLFSQSNHLIGDEILTQATFDYLKQNLGFNVKTESFKVENNIYNFKLELNFIDKHGVSEKIPLIEPCYQNCFKNSLESYVFSDFNFENFNLQSEYIDVGKANITELKTKDPYLLEKKIHVIERDPFMALDSQVLNSISYGAIGCVVYNHNGYDYEKDTLYYHPNETITRDYLINNQDIDIPVISISFNAAKEIISKKGKLHMSKQRKQNTSDMDNTQLLTNLYTTIPGVWQNNEIIIGVQRDTFSYNGFNSGHLIFLQLCKSLAALKAKGWKPIRTIRLISFDGNTLNNYGAKKQYLKNKKEFDDSILYIDIQRESITGETEFNCEASHMVKEVIQNALQMITVDEEDRELDIPYTFNGDFNIGSMETASLAYEFFYKKNVPTLNCKFINNNKTFPHNSNFFTREFVENHLDTDNYKLHKLLSKFYGILILMLDESEVIPYSNGNFIANAADEFDKIIDDNQINNQYAEKISDCFKDLKIILNSFDLYNKRLLHLAYVDYPWYKGLRKWKLFFKIKSSNKKIIAIKNWFITSIRKELTSIRLEKINFEEENENLIFQPNALEGGKIIAFGKMKELLLLNDRQNLVNYLRNLYKDLRAIKRFALDAYPV
ncbi:hypothetical protein QEN19_004405 [Hanseniaspora menglaensis]